MIFNSFVFFVFFLVVFFGYWFVVNRNLRLQNVFLLVASYVFYGWWDWRFLSLIALSSLQDYYCGIKIGAATTPGRRKAFLTLSIVTNLGFLAYFKYFNFFIESFSEVLASIGLQANTYSLQIILPVGISFYTFQTMSYSIDVYRGQMKPTKDLLAFLAYVSFFPQLVAGPIERAINLLPQFTRKRVFNYLQATDGLRLILWGFFKKLVIADNCAPYVNEIFNAYGEASGAELVLAVILFAFQIYGDFSGYSDIAIGTGKLLGFELMTNFRTPYFSRDIAEFWRRWHISLSTWFRDYLYFPLGGSRNGIAMTIRNTFIIFLVSGLWHGANWTFIIWGGLNALYFLPLVLLKKNRNNLGTVAEGKLLPKPGEVFQIAMTFALTCFAWIFFRSETVADAFHYIGRIFTSDLLGTGAPTLPNKFMLLVLPLFLLVEWLSRESGINGLAKSIQVNPVRYGFYFLLLSMIGIFGAFKQTEFIYFQF